MSVVGRVAARGVADVVARLAARVAVVLPDARVEVRDDAVVVRGRGVREALRWPAGLLR